MLRVDCQAMYIQLTRMFKPTRVALQAKPIPTIGQVEYYEQQMGVVRLSDTMTPMATLFMQKIPRETLAFQLMIFSIN